MPSEGIVMITNVIMGHVVYWLLHVQLYMYVYITISRSKNRRVVCF